MCVLSPLVYYLSKERRVIGLIVWGFLYIGGLGVHNPGVDTIAIFFFSLGAWLSINCVYPNGQGKISSGILLISLALFIVDVTIWLKGESNYYLHRLFVTFGVASLFIVFLRITTRTGISPLSKYLAECSFFIYAFHFFITPILNKCWVVFIRPVNGITSFCALFFIPLVASAICVTIYTCMKKIIPDITSIMVGSGRNKA